MEQRGKFIALEGIDGSGTTTQSRLLTDKLKARDLEVTLTAEPSDGPIGKVIRDVLKGNIQTPANALALLFAADRVEHYDSLIRPTLEKGSWVVSDRYLMSSIVYQSINSDSDWVRFINNRVSVPDINILLDLPVDKALSRLEKRGDNLEIFEKKGTMEQIRRLYLEAAKDAAAGLVKIIDATPPPEDVNKDILNSLRDFFSVEL